MFYVYGLRLNDSSEYRYVGSTYDMDTRLYDHFHAASNKPGGRNEPLKQWLNDNGPGRVVMDLLEEVTDGHKKAEQNWIAKLSKNGHPLFNIRMAHKSDGDFHELPESKRAAIITRYLDDFERDTDKPWLKEDTPVYFT